MSGNLKQAAIGLLISIFILTMLVSCPVPSGDNSQNTGSTGTAGDNSDNPNQNDGDKLEMPDKLLKSMDFPAEYTIIELTDTRENAHVVYTVNPPRTQEIAQLHITDLQTRGYTSDDNPSRILEGVEFTGGEWRRIYVKVTEESGKGTIVTIDVDY